jgi:acyl carrier protein
MNNVISLCTYVDDLKKMIAEILKIPSEGINEKQDIAGFGINSLNFLLLVGKINTHFHCKFSVEQIYNNFTIHDLAGLIQRSNQK